MTSLWRLIRHLKPYWLSAVLAPLFMALEVAMDLAQPRLLQQCSHGGPVRGTSPACWSIRNGNGVTGARVPVSVHLRWQRRPSPWESYPNGRSTAKHKEG